MPLTVEQKYRQKELRVLRNKARREIITRQVQSYLEVDENKNLIRKFLTYAFKDINFKYNQLTGTEKSFCTEQEFERLVAWIRAGNVVD